MFNLEKNFSFERNQTPESPESSVSEKVEEDKEEIITEEDWRRMENNLRGLYQDKEWERFFALAANMKIISPESFENIPFLDKKECREQGVETRKKALEERKKSGKWPLFFSEAARLSLLFPERREEFLDDASWEEIKRQIKNEVRAENSHWALILNQLFNIKMVFPERYEELGIDEGKIKEILEKEKKLMAEKKTWERLCYYQALEAALFSNNAQEVENKGEIRKRLEELRENASFYKREDLFSEMAAYAKIAFQGCTDMDKGTKKE